MTEEKEINEKEASSCGSGDSVLKLQGTVIFKLMNEGSKSEGNFPFLKLSDNTIPPLADNTVNPQSDISVILQSDNNVIPRLDQGISPDGDELLIPLYLENSNPFENSTLKQFEGKEITAEGTMKDGVFHISKIAPCSDEKIEL